jgi:hypothetical protein
LKDKDALFKQHAEDATAPGSHLFNRDTTPITETLFLHTTNPLITSQISTPNLAFNYFAPAPSQNEAKKLRLYVKVSKSQDKQYNGFLDNINKNQSVDINDLTTTESKYMIRKKQMLLAQAQQSKRDEV